MAGPARAALEGDNRELTRLQRPCAKLLDWAMPTQATANAMYNRQAVIMKRLFDPAGRRPSLVLAHARG